MRDCHCLPIRLAQVIDLLSDKNKDVVEIGFQSVLHIMDVDIGRCLGLYLSKIMMSTVQLFAYKDAIYN